MKKLWMLIPLGAVLFISFWSLRPIAKVSQENAIRITGVVESVSQVDETGDISIRLKDNPTSYYINRGIQNGMSVPTLQEQIKEKEVTILYPDHWTPLDPLGHYQHVSRITLEEENIYDEIGG